MRKKIKNMYIISRTYECLPKISINLVNFSKTVISSNEETRSSNLEIKSKLQQIDMLCVH